ncbi:transporter substrate-binding domain-containing protein [Streptomyces sp. TRM 70351]|uniref:transporter substrate-binding domain-containing protein n=1 Tax=Streptomyces sp. TRM 70351 TaxID=3116552 RepID=UPI002E7BEFA1|nr:transporter substrate-binding domain-containing protein [Streptomyces sp. TRM 70351]MEE1931002.1 transporter substrate-binding domain-containing protein [Streptomyces sp. TRM 70351]
MTAAAALALTATACSGQDAGTEFLGVERVTVAMHNDLPGLGYSSNYDRSGLDYLLYRHLTDHLDVAFSEPADVSSQDRVVQLEGRAADLIIASFSITPDRMEKIDFVGPYLTTRQGFLVDADGSDIREKTDLRGQHICTWEGTTSQDALDDLKETTGVEPHVLDDASDCIEALREDRVDAMSTDQAILYGFARHHAKDGLRVVPGLTIGAPQHYGIGLRKGHREDCRRLTEWLKGYVGSSTWIKDVEVSLPKLVDEDPGWISTHKPNGAAIDARSCRDEASP